MRIISRSAWGAKPAKRPVSAKSNQKGWELHHSTGSHDINGARRMRSVQSGHLNHKTINYADIAYNFCVDFQGNIYEARGWKKSSGANSKTNENMSVCLLGDYSNVSPSPEQLGSLTWLVNEGAKYGVPRVWRGGHRDWVKTTCPGSRGYAALPELRRRLEHKEPEPMRYKNVLNVPDDGTSVLPWAARVVDEGLDSRVLRPELEYDWDETDLTFGRVLTLILRSVGRV